MVALPERLVPIFLRATRANTAYVSAEGALRRIRDRALRPRPYGPPRRLRSDVDIDVRHADGWAVYTLTPAGRNAVGSVIYLHGGGWVNEIAPQHWQLAAQIASDTATTVVVPIYPLVPFGTARETADRVAKLVDEYRQAHGPVCLTGDSAGGQIALSTALLLRDRGTTLPATVLISPALDLSWSNPRIPDVQPTDPWLGVPGGRVLAEHWRGESDILDPIVSPLFGDLTGLGPITLLSGTRDVLNPDARLLADKARTNRVEITFHELDGQLHVYALLPTKAGASARTTIVGALARSVQPGR